MSDVAIVPDKPRGKWTSTLSLVALHALAFGMLYLIIVQMNGAFRDFFLLVGIPPTQRFEFASSISDYVAAYTPLVLLALAIHLFIVFRLSRSVPSWVSTYSHAVLLCMGCAGFLWTAWAVHCMTWSKPAIERPAIAVDGALAPEHLAGAQ
ncbi:hypothetical protein NHH03_24355 [Stieleria sp. TO1_6]|uniref:hypothetical protein n=1 Tax=Stieleria tagensis TaxID=2956795 RepID=UPI00209A91E8|nr:hypothetical protein [Stieleria tagensis]MCO8124892.1 hypothetical protein [Stieleria tagensis]